MIARRRNSLWKLKQTTEINPQERQKLKLVWFSYFFPPWFLGDIFSLYFLIADGIEMALDCEGDGGVTPSKPDKATQKWLSGNHPCSHKNVSFVHKSILREILCCDSAINVFLQVYLFYVLKIF